MNGLFDHIVRTPAIETALAEDAPVALFLPLWERVAKAKERHAEVRTSAELLQITEVEDPEIVPLLEGLVSQSRELIALLR